MTFKATVIEGGRLVLENGARLLYSAGDCEEPLRPGDCVLLDTGREPSIRKAEKSGAWSPVSETKVVAAAQAVSQFEALVKAHGDDL